MGILQPVVALAIWTMVMWFWMYATRIPAMSAAKLSDDEMSRLTSAKLDEVLPPHVQWKAYNYNHLHEAPTVFYAIAIVLAVIGMAERACGTPSAIHFSASSCVMGRAT